MSERFTLRVPVPAAERGRANSSLVGRNGEAPIVALEVVAYEGVPPHVVAYIHGISRRGQRLHGGFYLAHAEVLDALCEEWLRARGRWPEREGRA